MDRIPCYIRIKEGMQIRGMKQAELANKTGISKSMISEYVNGIHEPKQNGVHAIALALNVSEVWLMGISDDMERKPVNKKNAPFGINDELEEYLINKNRSDLFELYKNVTESDSMRILMDAGASDLTPEDLEPILILIQGIRKQRGLD